MDYNSALQYLYSFTNFEVTPAGTYSSKTFDLERIEKLLASLGNPHERFKSVHIAGTKGKGSTAAMIESVLRTAGLRTGFFTSPHLHTFRERIRVNGEMISKSQVAAWIQVLMPLVAQVAGTTTFEIMTALALGHFAGRGVDIAVLEVGLGGRLDATNIVTPLISVITSVSYDHTSILGNTLAQIAREKAGIIKQSVPTVCSPQSDDVLEVIRQVALDKESPLTLVSPALEFRVDGKLYQVLGKSDTLESQAFSLVSESGDELELTIPLGGKHQLSNAATALATLLVLEQKGLRISDQAIVHGFEHVEWKGRLEILGKSPLILVDGAHNADSMHQLSRALRTARPDSGIHLIFGASNDKDIKGMFKEILPYAESLILTRSHNPRAADPLELAKLANQYSIEVTIAPDLGRAIDDARTRANSDDMICVTGSLYMVAEAREMLLKEQGIQVEKD